jgi:hypothetical protein
MLLGRILFFFLLLHLVDLQLQINLHLTSWTSEDENLQHDCLHVAASIEKETDPRQIISYCMSEWPSKFNIKENNIDQKLTFAELSKQLITSQQLYLWSAPMDVIEQYQFYLDQLPKSEKTPMSTQIFYNCTLPNFGPKCQYVFSDHKTYHSSLDELIHDYYYYKKHQPILLTCYVHLQCDRGPSPSCLHWNEICDGKVDCIDGNYDEEHCWQLEIHQCHDNEYQCSNGQCIPITFFKDDPNIADCLDQSDEEIRFELSGYDESFLGEPSFKYEDVICPEIRNSANDYLIRWCPNERKYSLLRAMFSIKPNLLLNECWSAMKCIMRMPTISTSVCTKLCAGKICDNIIQNTCPDIIYVPAVPVVFGHVYLAYKKEKAQIMVGRPAHPQYACYNTKLLHLPIDNETLLPFNNTACRDPPEARFFAIQRGQSWEYYIRQTYRSLWKFQSLTYNDPEVCNRSNMYQCFNSSKCISKSRLYDGVADCFHNDDEGKFFNGDEEGISVSDKHCLAEQSPHYFKCITTKQCIPRQFVGNLQCDCKADDDGHCDDEHFDVSYARNTISFQTICDGFTHILPKFNEDNNETDETNCEDWPLIHIYNRCDGFWHFLNGIDEINCDESPLLNCSENNHICVSDATNELMCLPIEKANDGIIDCIGAADEPTLCQTHINYYDPKTFHCKNHSVRTCINAIHICNGYTYCTLKEDQRVCKSGDIIPSVTSDGICTKDYESNGSDVAKVLCRHFLNIGHRWKAYFTLDQSQNLIKQTSSPIFSHQSNNRTIEYFHQRCHRGIELQVWLDKEKNLTTNTCLCPPSYYGDTCQYQNQRVSLTIQFHVTSDSVQIPFIIIISLIDENNERIIHSSEQFTYLSVKHCQRKFNFYLLYSTKPKIPMRNYSIHFDIYEKTTLNYRGSIIRPLQFSFLPIHRLAFQLTIPRINEIQSCLDDQCINGKCIKYFNDPNNKTFCQCKKGWSGQYCKIKHTCTCSSDSLCIGKLAEHRSLCICPLNIMGPRCLIDNTICQIHKNEICLNHGQCIPLDEYGISKMKFACICSKRFTGDRCETNVTQLVVSFDKNITLPRSILIHFVEAKLNAPPVRSTTFKTIPNGQNSMTVYWSLPFHIAFAELSNKTYYLISMQKMHRHSTRIPKVLTSADRCLHINESLNETFANFSLLRRIKYYHSLCRTNLSCFYDEIHFCLCQQLDQQRVANCFEFDHNRNMHCYGQNGCENGGRCFQEYTDCPRTSICECPLCYYGAQCQLSTNGFSLSLDAIIGYHILPNIKIIHQPCAVLVSLVLSTIIIIAGIINGILSFITFKNQKTRESGCGIYLLCSSIITLFVMIIFTMKFWILIISHIESIQNRLFLSIQCHSIDFFLRFCLTMDQWLTAFVSIERAYMTLKGIKFDKKKTRSAAKWTISGLVIVAIGTNIHDPIYRRLFDEIDDEEKRIWCIPKYPSGIRIIDSVMNMFHFIIPFIINLISAIIIIIVTARQRTTIQTQQKYIKVLKEQIEQHKNLLIGPCVLIILSIPRLIISFASDCIKSSSDSWLFLVGYFISFIPPTLTFILFVLPSTTYKEASRKAISQYRKILTRRL